MVSCLILLHLYITPYMRSLPGESTPILLYNTVTEELAIFIHADTRMKGVQVGDHEIKQ